MNLTARVFDLENQDALILSTVENLERIRPKVETFMNGKSYSFSVLTMSFYLLTLFILNLSRLYFQKRTILKEFC